MAVKPKKYLKISIPPQYFDKDWYKKYKAGVPLHGITFEVVTEPETEQCQTKNNKSNRASGPGNTGGSKRG